MIGNRFRTLLVAIAGALTIAPLLADGVAYRVKDLRTQVSEEHYLGGDLTAIDLGAMVYLDFLNLGREPWITDGTQAGTRLMANLAPGSMGSDPVELGKVGATVFLAATTPATGRELWRTNGRAWGTAQVADIRVGPMGSDPEPLAVLGDAVLFVADDGFHGAELWRSDGTAAGTWLLADLVPGVESSFRFGTSEGASEELDGKVYFSGRDTLHGSELWVTDGTPAGTHLLLDLSPGVAGSDPWTFVSFGGRLYFSAQDPDHGDELWVTDGTAAGTHVLVDIMPGAASSRARAIGGAQHGLIFVAEDPSGYPDHPWVTDGTAPGTVKLGSVEAEHSGIVLGGKVLFTGNDALYDWEPWVTDGTRAGTRRVADIYPGEYPSEPRWGARGQGFAYFCADDATGLATHLFRTTGTAVGTKSLPEVECSWISDAAIVGGVTLLNACWWEEESCPGCGYSVCRLWRTDGTTAGTWSVYPGARLIAASRPGALTPGAAGILFAARPDLPYCGNYSQYPFVSDGSEAGTSRLTGAGGGELCLESSEAAPLANGEVLFRGWQEATGSELWTTDAAGAHLLRDLADGAASSAPLDLATVGPLVYFSAVEPATGREPWITDGTFAGTALVDDIGPGATGSYPGEFADVFGRAWFSAYTAAAGVELWESAGTPATTELHDLTPGSNSTRPKQITPLDETTGSLVYLSGTYLFSYVPGEQNATFLRALTIDRYQDFGAVLAVSGGTLYFVDSTNTPVCWLWASDGTTAGTHPVTQIWSGYGRAWEQEWVTQPCPTELVALGDRLYFGVCRIAQGCELWSSDGTAAGTGLFADLEPGPGSFLPWSLTVIGEKLYFAGCRAASGCEPWVSDGTPAGTHRVADIALGPPSSDPHAFTLSGRLVYFGADDTTGTELWAMPLELFYDGFESGDASRWDPPTP